MRISLTVLCFALISSVPVHAQSADSGAQLRALLEKNFSKPKATGRAAPARADEPASTSNAPSVDRPSELLIIRPGGKVDRVPVKKRPDRRSKAATGANIREAAESGGLNSIWNLMKGLWQPAAPTGGKPLTLTAGAASSSKSPAPSTRSATSSLRLAEASSRMRSSKAFGVVPDVYIVHFKNIVTEEQMLNVVRKYNLDVVGTVPALGIIYVKRKKTDNSTATSGSRSVGSTPEAKKSDARKAESVLNPDFLQKLRKEPGINAATVHSTVAPKYTPRPTGTTITDNGHPFTWTWQPGVTDDGNWGLKRMRLPPVWHILKSYRATRLGGEPVTMGFLDSGFSYHGHLAYNVVHGLKKDELLPFSGATCEESHGTHVAGIAGAAHGRGRGIDGIVPEARIDIIPLQADDVLHGMEVGISGLQGQSTMLFVTAVKDLVEYLQNNPVKEGAKRVINISLGFNWRNQSSDEDLSNEFVDGELISENKKSVVISFASMLQQWLKPFEKDTVFVIAGGNDSENLEPPLHAKWSSPFTYLGLAPSKTFQRAPNFIVVEALNRRGRRASFSNSGGQVSAPGMDVMSTIGGRGGDYAICDGTSQAAPHVTALAAILIEMAPEKTPVEIVDIIVKSAIPDPSGLTAPRVDALEAVLMTNPKALNALADLNTDGVVDVIDLKLYKRYQIAMTTVFKSKLSSYLFDHNQNGKIDDNEHWYPRIDLNGSGGIDVSDKKLGCLRGRPVTDLDVLKSAWAGNDQRTFEQAALELGLLDKPTDTEVSTSSIVASSTQARCKW